MKIAIDIDDVITDTSSSMRNCIMQHDETGEVSRYIVEVMRGEIPTEAVKKFLAENILDILKNVDVKENAAEVISRLRQKGNEIFLVTSRGEERYKGSQNFTVKFLKENNIECDGICFDIVDKATVCKRNGIEMLIDDSVKYCEEADKVGVKGIIFTSDVNKSIETTSDRVDNWLELEEKIEQIILKKKEEQDGQEIFA